MAKIEHERRVEIDTWEQKKEDLEQAVQKCKKVMHFNLNNHKDATDRLRAQLKEAEVLIGLKEEENRQLLKKLTILKLQVGKLEKVQLRELSRSRSSQRVAAGELLRFAHLQPYRKDTGEVHDNGIRTHRSNGESSADSNLRLRAKYRLYGEHHMQRSLLSQHKGGSGNHSRAASGGNLDDLVITNAAKRVVDSFKSAAVNQGITLVASPVTSICAANQKRKNANFRYSTNKWCVEAGERKIRTSNQSSASLDKAKDASAERRQGVNSNESDSRKLKQYMQTVASRKHVQTLKENQGQLTFANHVVAPAKTQGNSFVDTKRRLTKTFLQSNRYGSNHKKAQQDLYNSIQCHASPEKERLQPGTTAVDPDNRSVGTAQKYLGQITSAKKLISNLTVDNSLVNAPKTSGLTNFV